MNKQSLRGKFNEFIFGISFIQKRIKTQLSLKYSKVDVLINFWDKIIGCMIRDKAKFKDKKADKLTVELTKVPKSIRDACLKKYTDHCKAVYNIAFMQWRLFFPTTSEYADEEELKEIIMGRIHFQQKQTSQGQRVSKETDELAAISTDFLIKYDFADNHRLAPFTINSFAQIGLSDPFPDDDQFIEGSLDDVNPDLYKMPDSPEVKVYPDDRYRKGFCPYCIYIPRKEIMLKLMRACIGVRNPSELWFNLPPVK